LATDSRSFLSPRLAGSTAVALGVADDGLGWSSAERAVEGDATGACERPAAAAAPIGVGWVASAAPTASSVECAVGIVHASASASATVSNSLSAVAAAASTATSDLAAARCATGKLDRSDAVVTVAVADADADADTSGGAAATGSSSTALSAAAAASDGYDGVCAAPGMNTAASADSVATLCSVGTGVIGGATGADRRAACAALSGGDGDGDGGAAAPEADAETVGAATDECSFEGIGGCGAVE
jgi:hypothetical protein